jgi:hypothetical protein
MKNDKKQTAVEWFFETIRNSRGMEQPEIDKVLDQAKAMEKEQIEDAHEIGYINGGNHKNVNGEQYYNETYKQQ